MSRSRQIMHFLMYLHVSVTRYEPVQAAHSTKIEYPGLSIRVVHKNIFFYWESRKKTINFMRKDMRKINHQSYFCLKANLELSATDFICQILRLHLKIVLIETSKYGA